MLKAPYVTGPLTEHFADDAFGTLEGYVKRGGYQAARKALGEMTPEAVIDLVKNSGLQGRGGAGFGTGLKWSFMPKTSDKPKYLVCNADESEPGSFKDRILMERGPHQILEGILIAAFATGASKTFLYVRGEYAFPADQIERAVAEAYAKGYLGKNVLKSGFAHDVVVQRGAGAYICGEETGLLESLEGKKGHASQEAALPRAARRLRHADDGEQRRDLFARAAHHQTRGRVVSHPRHREEPGHHDLRCVRATWPGPASTSCRSARASTRSSSSTPAASPAAASSRA